ncbi:MAG: hypothetical protein IH845_03915 [Nanoarchaeota archaeon]|nr:hypothetical protein [Nanoarchaeota archaeon]
MNFKEWFKLKPYWLKGGLITIGIYVSFSLIFLLFDSVLAPATNSDVVWFIGYFIFGVPILIISGILEFIIESIFPVTNLYFFGATFQKFLVFTWSFALGSFIGWVVGRGKNTNK